MGYPTEQYPSGLPAGQEISPAPTQGGSKITLLESLVTAPNVIPVLGEPAVVGSLSGVVVTEAAAGGDLVLQTSGIFSVAVKPHDGAANKALAIGDPIYIDEAASALVDLNSAKTLFGYALNSLAGSATASLVCVKLATA